MMERLRHFFRVFWAEAIVEVILVPPFVVALCYYLYGEIYFSSWYTFALITLPWFVSSPISGTGCHWVRRTMLRRFKKLED